MTTTKDESCGFQGIENLNTTQIKRWLGLYLLMNQRFESKEAKEKAINTLYVKAMLFFQETDMRVNERNIANPDIQRKLLEFAKADITQIESFLQEKEKVQEQEKMETTAQTQIGPGETTEKKPCGCGGHSHTHENESSMMMMDMNKEPNEVECTALALVGALVAYLFVPTKFLYYVLGAIGLILLASFAHKYMQRKKAKEQDEETA